MSPRIGARRGVWEAIAELSGILGTDGAEPVILDGAPPRPGHRVLPGEDPSAPGGDIRRTRFEARAIREYLDAKPLYAGAHERFGDRS